MAAKFNRPPLQAKQRPKPVDGEKCLLCGDKHAPFGFGHKHNRHWLCFACWLSTPDGQRQTLLQNKKLTQDEKDTDGIQ